MVQRYYEYTKHPGAAPRDYIAHETLLALEYAHTKRDRDGRRWASFTATSRRATS